MRCCVGAAQVSPDPCLQVTWAEFETVAHDWGSDRAMRSELDQFRAASGTRVSAARAWSLLGNAFRCAAQRKCGGKSTWKWRRNYAWRR